jgi:hypothetical protein
VTFSQSTGAFTFFTNDMESFTPGDYVWAWTVAVGASTETVNFKLTLKDTCSTLAPAINHNPFPEAAYEYVLGRPALVLDYDLDTIGNVQSDLICGFPQIRFVNGQFSDELSEIVHVDYSA